MMNRELSNVLNLVLLGFGFWFVSFYLNPFNFWLEMAASVAILAFFSLLTWSSYEQLASLTPRNVMIGVFSALALYGLFWLGNIIVTELIPFAESEIGAIYENTGSTALPVIGVLLFLVIGPGEEIFWRGTVQRKLEESYGNSVGLLVGAGLYALVHFWSLNLTLVLAALVAGLVWGWIYARENDLVPVIISHSVWSVLIFLIIPV